jgi:CRP/FNR family cyclic AMP-dependent transcriptional regulator
MDLLNLISNVDTEFFEAGTTIFEVGSIANCMYVVVQGGVSIKVGDEVVDTAGVGEMFGEMAMVDATPRSATAVANVDCKLAKIDERLFLYMVQQTPFFALHVMRVMAERLRRMNKLNDA